MKHELYEWVAAAAALVWCASIAWDRLRRHGHQVLKNQRDIDGLARCIRTGLDHERKRRMHLIVQLAKCEADEARRNALLDELTRD